MYNTNVQPFLDQRPYGNFIIRAFSPLLTLILAVFVQTFVGQNELRQFDHHGKHSGDPNRCAYRSVSRQQFRATAHAQRVPGADIRRTSCRGGWLGRYRGIFYIIDSIILFVYYCAKIFFYFIDFFHVLTLKLYVTRITTAKSFSKWTKTRTTWRCVFTTNPITTNRMWRIKRTENPLSCTEG